jgi:sulfur carrier protein ThiS
VKVVLKAGGMLTDYLKPDLVTHAREVETAEGQTLRQILESIGVPPGHVAMAFVDSNIVHLSYVPKEGEVITIRPPVQGG